MARRTATIIQSMDTRRPNGHSGGRSRAAGNVFRLPPPPPGLPPRLRAAYLIVAAIVSAVVTLVVPMCPRLDDAGRPLWRVETVHDGDTVTCVDPEGRAWKIRLVGIDAPEFGQPFGEQASQALARKLGGGHVRVEGDARDQHGRLLGTLRIADRDINRELVAEGWAWAFGGFASDDALLAAEAEARRQRHGLWAGPDPIPPREWRELHPAHR
ncbi:MAG: thermonuclease family protein [Planctomycetaceae bacterium]